MTAKPPCYKFRLWVTRQSFPSLLVCWTGAYLFAGFAFAGIYALLPQPPIKDATRATPDLLDILHFSFVTQATVGYGDWTPVLWARLVADGQAFFGIAMNAVLLGMAVYKFTKRTQPLKFPSVLVYDPNVHKFWFRFWNTDADNLRNVQLKVTVFAHSSNGTSYDTISSMVVVDYEEARFVPSVHLFALRTATNTGEHIGAIGELYDKIKLYLCPLHLKPGVTIRLDVSGYFETTGDAFFANKDYGLADVRCGTYCDVDNFAIAHLPIRERSASIAQRLDRTDSTSRDSCAKCHFHQQCPLDVASRSRDAPATHDGAAAVQQAV
jgi:hypothetical protein